MFATSLKCRCCGKEYPLTDLYLCPNCGGLIEVQYSESDLLCKENVLSLIGHSPVCGNIEKCFLCIPTKIL